MRNADEIFELIAEQVADISSHIAHEPITPNSMLSPLGMDSIGRAELIERMLEILDLNESRFHFHEANNLGELAEMFEKKIKEKEIRESTIIKDSVWNISINHS